MIKRAMLVMLLCAVMLPPAAGAGQLDPAGAPSSGSGMPTLSDIYNRLDTGASSTPAASFQEPASGPTAGTGKSLSDIQGKLPAPDNAGGATTSDVRSGRTFWGLRTDGTWGRQTGTKPVCSSPLTECGTSCVYLQNDLSNCGWCGNVCSAGTVCSQGSCSPTCGGGTTLCNGICVNTEGDNWNCGSCGTICLPGQSCSLGACSVTCPVGQTKCGEFCRDTTTDRSNCGGCGSPCAAGEICTGSVCVLSCQSGLANCSGVCTNLNSDTNRCGTCGTACPAGTGCHLGVCN